MRDKKKHCREALLRFPPRSKDRMSCLIVGGGIIGLSLAWELAGRQQACRVVDQGEIGRGCSWAGAGILPPARLDTALDPIDRLRGLSHEIYPQWTAQLTAETGIDTGFRRCGGIYVARRSGEAASLLGQIQYWNAYGIEAKQLSSAELAKLEPALGGLDELRMAILAPEECQVRPPHLLRALTHACRQRGVVFTESTRVTGLLHDPGNQRVSGVSTDSGDYFAETIVLCCGAWASQFADPRGRLKEVFPVRGQVLIYRAPPGLLHCVINEGNRYLLPRDDGHLYVGSSEEEVGWQQGTTPEIVASLKNWAEQLVPTLAGCEIERTFSGLRPGSMDSFPFLGRSPDYENLYLASGHFRSGLHLACGTARVLAELIGDRPLSVPIESFAVGR